MASLTQALEALIREPYGCFEQTSATVYPNIMAQQYFKTHSGVSPQLMEKSYKLLGTGLDKLRSFEVKGSGGYEWFGSEPAHEALTAYGLLEFVDMAQVGRLCVLLPAYLLLEIWSAPAHGALTAYGSMESVDMAQVVRVCASYSLMACQITNICRR